MKKQYDKYYVADFSYEDPTPCNNYYKTSPGCKKSYDLWANCSSNKPSNNCLKTSNLKDFSYECDYSYDCLCNDTSDSFYKMNSLNSSYQESCDSSYNTTAITDMCNNTIEYSAPSDFCNYNNLLNYRFGRYNIKTYNGNAAEFTFKPNDCEVRVDLDVNKSDSIVLWGEVRNNCEEPCSNILVTLLKPTWIRGKIEYLKEGSTLTNSIGFYQFQIDYKDKDSDYKVLLGQNC